MDAGRGWGGAGSGVRGGGGGEQRRKPTFIRSLELFNSVLSLEWCWRGPRSQKVGGGVILPNKSSNLLQKPQ